MTVATRFELISALYDDVSKDVIRSPSNWQEFLKSSCNNYGLPFSEQLLVYAQEPDAVAVLPMASWNRKFGRWINKGAKGVALFDLSNQNYPRLKYVFDVSDTHGGDQAKEVPIWHMKDDYTDNVIKTLENVFGAVDNQSDLGSAVISACENAVSDSLSDYLFELCNAKQDSFLEDFSDDIISSKFRKLVSNGVSYTVLSRLGVDADLMIDTEDFKDLLISIHQILLMPSVKQQTIFQKQHSLKYQKPYLHLKKKIAYLKKLQQVPTIKMKTKTKGAIQMKITYTQVGEQFYPNLIMPTKTEQMGYYAQRRQEYLKNHKKATFTTLLTTCKLTEHLMSIQEQAQQMEEQIITQMAKAQGVTEKLKQTNMMTWIGMMNNIKNSARETVLNELIYTM